MSPATTPAFAIGFSSSYEDLPAWSGLLKIAAGAGCMPSCAALRLSRAVNGALPRPDTTRAAAGAVKFSDTPPAAGEKKFPGLCVESAHFEDAIVEATEKRQLDVIRYFVEEVKVEANLSSHSSDYGSVLVAAAQERILL
ncbi:hypothetical protein N7513_009122 [Penicillium frequentans]|nr:hypothetical protein N7513_009122 [Penicillium glabrum]